MKTLKYNYMDKIVEVKAIKSDSSDGYFLIEQLIDNDANHEPQIVAGSYLTRKATLIAGQKYIDSIMGE